MFQLGCIYRAQRPALLYQRPALISGALPWFTGTLPHADSALFNYIMAGKALLCLSHIAINNRAHGLHSLLLSMCDNCDVNFFSG